MKLAAWAALAVGVCPAATLLRTPYVQNVAADRATILWVTRELGEGLVEYSADGKLWRAVPAEVRAFTSQAGATRHQYQAELRDLASGRSYQYRVRVDGEILKDGVSFRTAGPGPFTFLVFGDSGTGSEEQAALARQMFAEDEAALVLHTGDLSQDDGSLDRMEAHYFAVYAPLMSRVPFFPTLGNHDYGTDLAAPYLFVHVLPVADAPPAHAERYYSFDWGGAHFVSLDSNLLIHPEMTTWMLAWLERDLQKTRRFWKVVFFHHPPFPTGHHAGDALCEQVRLRVLPILERYGVQVTFSGHEHNYQRSKPLRNGLPVEAGAGLISIITGGGGAGLHPVGSAPELAFGESVHHYLRVRVEDWRMSVTAVALGGRILDRFVLAPPPEISSDGLVNAACFGPALAPGSLIAVFGRNLAVEDRSALNFPLPVELAGTGVSVEGRPLPLLFVSPNQINAQLPYGIEGPARLRVSTPNGSMEASLRLTATAPALLYVSASGARLPAIVRQEAGEVVSPSSPAMAGDTLAIYLVGLGEVAGAIPAGQPAPEHPPLGTRHPVEVRVGGLVLSPIFAGLAPRLAGVYQVNVKLPAELPEGDHPLRVVSNGAASETVTLRVGSLSPEDLSSELDRNRPAGFPRYQLERNQDLLRRLRRAPLDEIRQ